MKEIEEFYDNLWIWKQFEEFYKKYPNHPCRWIHEDTKKRLDVRFRIQFYE